MATIILISFAIMAVSLVGAATLLFKGRRVVEENLPVLINFAVGVFGAASYFLLIESSELIGLFASLLWVAAGAASVWVLSRLVSEYHHHHINESDHEHSRRSAYRILVSDAVHNIADGVLITTSFLTGGAIGFGVAISVLLHETIQELTEFFILKQAGYSTKQALVRNFAVASTILIGSIGSFYLLQMFAELGAPLLAIAAGGFMLALIQDLIPGSVKDVAQDKKYISRLVPVLIGAGLIIAINIVAGHGHDHAGNLGLIDYHEDHAHDD